MEDKILILDGSKRLHIGNTFEVLGKIEDIRQVPQNICSSFDRNFINEYISLSFNSQRKQVDVEEFMARLSTNTYLHRENRDALKVVIIDQDIYSSRENTNFGFGVNFSYTDANKYVIISTARFKDETHARHVLAHEIGHAFGAPSPSRNDVYESLGTHCRDRNCTMHQELSRESSYQQAQRIARQVTAYCSSCSRDIRRFVR